MSCTVLCFMTFCRSESLSPILFQCCWALHNWVNIYRHTVVFFLTIFCCTQLVLCPWTGLLQK